MVIKSEIVGSRTVAIKYPVANGLYCVEVAEDAKGWCYPWEVRQDGTRACAYSYASNKKQADAIFSEMVTREKMMAGGKIEYHT